MTQNKLCLKTKFTGVVRKMAAPAGENHLNFMDAEIDYATNEINDVEHELQRGLDSSRNLLRTKSGNVEPEDTGMSFSAAARVALLMSRFKSNMDQIKSSYLEEDDDMTPRSPRQVKAVRPTGKQRWAALRESFKPKAKSQSPRERSPEEILTDLKNEDEGLLNLWQDDTIPPPPFAVDGTNEALGYVVGPPIVADSYVSEFKEAAESVGIEISRIPEEVVLKHEEAMDEAVRREQMQAVEMMKRNEADLLWRENEARARVIESERRARENIDNHNLASHESLR